MGQIDCLQGVCKRIKQNEADHVRTCQDRLNKLMKVGRAKLISAKEEVKVLEAMVIKQAQEIKNLQGVVASKTLLLQHYRDGDHRLVHLPGSLPGSFFGMGGK